MSSGKKSLESFHDHLKTYTPKIYKFYDFDEKTGRKAIEVFRENAGILKVLGNLTERTGIFESFKIEGNDLHIRLSNKRLNEEIAFLKKAGISSVVSLTEEHHQKEQLGDHFDLHHISIEDLGAPSIDQVHRLAGIVASENKSSRKLAVHCLAGIGRTSTMLMASHIALGESPQDLEARLKRQNPSFVLTGPQGEFLRSLAAKK
jgi:atypical dual specificity phosphatase